jgi:ABC-type multidrug transport system permease subunit
MSFLFLISWVSGSIYYFMVDLHSGWDHFAYFVLMLIACVACVESLMMVVASIVPKFLMGIITGAGIQVR